MKELLNFDHLNLPHFKSDSNIPIRRNKRKESEQNKFQEFEDIENKDRRNGFLMSNLLNEITGRAYDNGGQG